MNLRLGSDQDKLTIAARYTASCSLIREQGAESAERVAARIWAGAAENLELATIPLFVFMGVMLERSGVAKDMLHSFQTMLGRVQGGLTLAVTLLGIILAAATGIVGASVVMMSMMALPLMLEQNYSKTLATGTIAASGTLGILIPPSIMLVVIADLLSKSVGTMFMAAFVPGMMLGGLYLVYILVISTLRPKLAPRQKNTGSVSLLQLIVTLVIGLVPAFLLIFFVLGSIIFGWATPTESAGVGAIGAIFLAFVVRPFIYALLARTQFAIPDAVATKSQGNFVKRFAEENTGWWTSLRKTLSDSMQTVGMIFMIVVCATVFSLTFRLLGGEHLITDFIRDSGYGAWHILIVVMILVFLLGFLFEWIEVTLIVLPVVAPIILSLDFGDHVASADVAYWFAILLAVNLQTSFLTPPMGPALFYMKAVSPPDVKIQDIYVGILPFVALQIIGLGLILAFPQIAMWLPHQMLGR